MLWTNRNGSQSIKTLETEHLQNIVNYVNKRLREYEEVQAIAQANKQKIPPLMFSGHKATTWMTHIIEELDKRHKKNIARARAILED